MLTFCAAFVLIWCGLFGYAVKLALHQRRLARACQDFDRSTPSSGHAPHFLHSAAADPARGELTSKPRSCS